MVHSDVRTLIIGSRMSVPICPKMAYSSDKFGDKGGGRQNKIRETYSEVFWRDLVMKIRDEKFAVESWFGFCRAS